MANLPVIDATGGTVYVKATGAGSNADPYIPLQGGGTVSISSTVAATQSGTWTVQPGNTANTTAWKVDGSAVTQPVSNASLPLPSGASTSANQTTELSSLASILAKLSADPSTETTLAAILAKIIAAPATSAKQDTLAALIGEVQASPTSNTLLERLKVIHTDLSGTLAISAASLPLPSGASTAANQTTTNTSLSSIDGKLVSGPSTAAKQDTGNTSLTSIDAKSPVLGQALAAASTPVVLTAAQVTTLTPPAAITGFATETTQSAGNTLIGAVTETAPGTDTASSGVNGRLQRVAQRLTSLIGLFPTALGGTTAANSFPVTLATDGQFSTSTGALTEAAPGTDTASSGLNGRLQRIAQRLTTLLAVFPATIDTNSGNKSASTLRVVLATDQVALTNALLVDTELPAAAALADGAANPTTPVIGGANLMFNGATWDRRQANSEGTALASALRTSVTSSADFINYSCRGIVLMLNVSAASGTGGLTTRVQVKDPVSGNYASVNVAPTAVIATATASYAFYPGASAGFSSTTSGVLPRTWRVQVTHGDSSNYTYSVGYSLIV